MIRRTFRVLSIAVLLFALTCAWVYYSHLRALERMSSFASKERAVRVAIVLGGGVGPDGAMANSSRSRVKAAIALLGTEGDATMVMAGRHSAAHMRDLAITLGFPGDRIVTEALSRTTLENLVRALPIAVQLGAAPDGSDILVVTDSMHALRAGWLLRCLGRESVRIGVSNSYTDYGPRSRAVILLRETAACWFNAVKLIAWGAIGLFGLTPEERLAHVR